MCKYTIEELNKIEITSKSMGKRISELINIINMKIDYREQINQIEKLIGDIE